MRFINIYQATQLIVTQKYGNQLWRIIVLPFENLRIQAKFSLFLIKNLSTI